MIKFTPIMLNTLLPGTAAGRHKFKTKKYLKQIREATYNNHMYFTNGSNVVGFDVDETIIPPTSDGSSDQLFWVYVDETHIHAIKPVDEFVEVESIPSMMEIASQSGRDAIFNSFFGNCIPPSSSNH